MRSPSAAIAWQLRRRHRWGLSAVLLYIVVLAAIPHIDATAVMWDFFAGHPLPRSEGG